MNNCTDLSSSTTPPPPRSRSCRHRRCSPSRPRLLGNLPRRLPIHVLLVHQSVPVLLRREPLLRTPAQNRQHRVLPSNALPHRNRPRAPSPSRSLVKRRPTPLVPRPHVGAAPEEEPHRRHLRETPHREVQCRVASVVDGVDIGGTVMVQVQQQSGQAGVDTGW